MNRLRAFILRRTHRLWNREISRILCDAYNSRIINSEQLHILASAFDPSQSHLVGSRKGFTGRWTTATESSIVKNVSYPCKQQS